MGVASFVGNASCGSFSQARRKMITDRLQRKLKIAIHPTWHNNCLCVSFPRLNVFCSVPRASSKFATRRIARAPPGKPSFRDSLWLWLKIRGNSDNNWSFLFLRKQITRWWKASWRRHVWLWATRAQDCCVRLILRLFFVAICWTWSKARHASSCGCCDWSFTRFPLSQ